MKTRQRTRRQWRQPAASVFMAGGLAFAIISIVLTFPASVRADGEWTILNPANPPSPRAGHTMNALPDGKVILFGGGDETQVYNDLYLFYNNAWNVLPSTVNPPARRDHASWYHNGKMYIHGGRTTATHSLQDIWSYDVPTKEWEPVPVFGTKPAARYGHLATPLPDGSVILIGGTDCIGQKLKDTWKFSPQDKSFTLLGNCPLPVSHLTGQLAGNLLWLFSSGNVITFDVNTNEWTVSSGGPPLTEGYTSAMTENGKIDIFGGTKYDGTESNAVYEYDTEEKLVHERQEFMPFSNVYGTSVITDFEEFEDSGQRKSNREVKAMNVLFFGGISGGKYINTTFLYSDSDTDSESLHLSVNVTGNTLSLSWNPLTRATGYYLYYAPFPEMSPVSSADLGNQTSLSAELFPGAAYYLAVQGYNSSGPLQLSNIGSFMIPPVLPAPVLAATAAGNTVSLNWTGVEGATGYILYYAPFPSASPIYSADLGNITSLSAELPEGSAFYVIVQAYNAQGRGAYSNLANFTIGN